MKTTMILLILLAVVGSSFCGFDPLPTSSQPVGTCTVSHTEGMVLNVRKCPAFCSEVIGGLLSGAKVEVIQFGWAWDTIRYNDGIAYVYSSYCEKSK